MVQINYTEKEREGEPVSGEYTWAPEQTDFSVKLNLNYRIIMIYQRRSLN